MSEFCIVGCLRRNSVRNSLEEGVFFERSGKLNSSSSTPWSSRALGSRRQQYSRATVAILLAVALAGVGLDSAHSTPTESLTSPSAEAGIGRATGGVASAKLKRFSKAPVPSVVGTPQVGGVLRAKVGQWKPTAKLRYAWYLNGKAVSGATKSSWKVTPAALGKRVAVKVTASRQGYVTTSKTSKSTNKVSRGVLDAPRPRVSGTVRVAATVRAEAGTWRPSANLTYQWYVDGVAARGATTKSWSVPASAVDKRVSVKVTGKRDGYTSKSVRSSESVVSPGVLESSVPVIVGTPAVAETVQAVAGRWSPGTSLEYTWALDGIRLAGASEATLLLPPDARGKHVTVTVVGKLAGYHSRQETSAGVEVAEGRLEAGDPVILGEPHIGQTVRVDTGEWTPGTSFGFEWSLDDEGAPALTGSEVFVTAEMVSRRLAVEVTGSKPGYLSVTKSASVMITPKSFDAAPQPVILGTPGVGKTLVLDLGEWSPAATHTVRWLLGGTPIAGATGAEYRVAESDAGGLVSVRVTGTRPGFLPTQVTSEPVEIPDVEEFVDAPNPLLEGTPVAGGALSVSLTGWFPAPDGFVVRWLRDGHAVEGIEGTQYELGRDDIGAEIVAEVTAMRVGWRTTTRSSLAVGPVLGDAFEVSPPVITGDALVGSVLTASAGLWSPTPDSLTWQWLRNGVPVPGATETSYALTEADWDQEVSVLVTGRRQGTAAERVRSTAVRVRKLVHLVDELTGDTTWSPLSADVYLVTGDVRVPAGATLTLEPGTVVKSRPGVGSATAGRLSVEGAIRVRGAVGEPVVLTSWRDDEYGVDVDGGSGTTGQAGDLAGIEVLEGGVLEARGAVIRFASVGVSVRTGGSASVRGSVIEETLQAVDAHGDTVVEDSRLSTTSMGVSNSGGASVRVSGSTLAGSGTGINGSAGMVVEDSSLSGFSVGVQVFHQDVVVKDSSFDAMKQAAVQVSAFPFDPVHIVAGNVATNSAINGVNMYNPVFADGAELFGRDGWGLVITNDRHHLTQVVNVPSGSTVSVPAGAVVKSKYMDGGFGYPDLRGGLRVAGELKVVGSSAQPAVMTSWRDDAYGGDTDGNGESSGSSQDFAGIEVLDGGVLEAQDAVIRYAWTGVWVGDGGSASVRDAVIEETLQAVDAHGDTVVEDSRLSTTSMGVSNSGGASVRVSGSTLAGSGTGINGSAGMVVEDSSLSGFSVGVQVFHQDVVVKDSSFDAMKQAAVQVSAFPFDPVHIVAGNVATNSAINGVNMYNPVFADGAELFGRDGWGLVITNDRHHLTQVVNVPSGSTVSVPAGAVVKFRHSPGGFGYPDFQGGLLVAGDLRVLGSGAQPVILTSWRDDTYGGDTNGNGTSSGATQDFAGIEVLDGGFLAAEAALFQFASPAVTVRSGGVATVRGRVLYTSRGIVADLGAQVDARHVDWGLPSGPAPFGGGASVSVVPGVLYFPWVGFLPFERPLTAPPQNVPSDNPETCGDLTLVALRGSGEDPQWRWETTPPTGIPSVSWFGRFPGWLSASIEHSVAMRRPGLAYKRIGIEYRAEPVPTLLFSEPPYGLTKYVQSIFDGVDKLLARMDAEVDDCGVDTKFVLMGYSQGALSAHIALNEMSPAMRARIVGVALIADPGRTALGPETTWSGAGVIHPAVLQTSGSWAVPELFMSGTLGRIPSDIAGRTISICHELDMVCATTGPSWLPPHENYSSEEFDAMAEWLAPHIVASL